VPRPRAGAGSSGVRQSNRTPKRKRWTMEGDDSTAQGHATLPSGALPGHPSRATSPNDDSSASTVSYSTQPAPGSVTGSGPGISPAAGGVGDFCAGVSAAIPLSSASLPSVAAVLGGATALPSTQGAALLAAAAAAAAATTAAAKTKTAASPGGKPKAGKPRAGAKGPGIGAAGSAGAAGARKAGAAKAGGARKRSAKGQAQKGAAGRGGKGIDVQPRLQPSPEAALYDDDSEDDEAGSSMDPHYAFAAVSDAHAASLPRPSAASSSSSSSAIQSKLNARRPRGGSEATISFRQAPPLTAMAPSSSLGLAAGAASGSHRGRAQSVAVPGMSTGRRRQAAVPLAPLALPGSGLGVTNVQMSPGGLLYGLASQSSDAMASNSPKAAGMGWGAAAAASSSASRGGGIAASRDHHDRSRGHHRHRHHHHHHHQRHTSDGTAHHDSDDDDSSGSEQRPAAFRRGRFPPGLDAPAPAHTDTSASSDSHHLPLGRGRRGSVMRSRRGSRHAMGDDDDDDDDGTGGAGSGAHGLGAAVSAGLARAPAPAAAASSANAPKRGRMVDPVEPRMPPVAVSHGSLSWGMAAADQARWQAAPAV